MRKWRAPNNPTAQAKQVWQALFPRESWPRGWRVQWVGFMRGAAGLTIYMAAHPTLSTYLQTDPRGAALYIIRPGDVPEGATVDSCYSRGICVY